MNTWILSLQNSNTPMCDLMIFFHDFTMMFLINITILILLIMIFLIFNNFTNRYLLHNHLMELIWTIFPMFILIFIALPSIQILYFLDESGIIKVTTKCLGNQWYWSYEYSDFLNVNFDSYMIPTNELNNNGFRLLDVDNRCILPFKYPIRMLSSSKDVIHSWTVPSLGIKMDSTPGRLNQASMIMYRPGLYFGQCSEICGMNHSFMPIVIEATNFTYFKSWLKNINNN